MTSSTACSKSWTDVNVDFKRGTIGHCCKSVYYDFPDELIDRGKSIFYEIYKNYLL